MADAGHISIAVDADFERFRAAWDAQTRGAETRAAFAGRAAGEGFQRSLQQALRGVNALSQVFAVGEFGFSSILSLSRAISGEWRDMALTVKELPFGLGRIAESLQPIVDRLFGVDGSVFAGDDPRVADRRREEQRRLQLERMRHVRTVAALEERLAAVRAGTDPATEREAQLASALRGVNEEYLRAIEEGGDAQMAETRRRLQAEIMIATYRREQQREEEDRRRRAIADGIEYQMEEYERAFERQQRLEEAARRNAVEDRMSSLRDEISASRVGSAADFVTRAQTAIGSFAFGQRDSGRMLVDGQRRVEALTAELVRLQREEVELARRREMEAFH
jgi:hypothetical protein